MYMYNLFDPVPSSNTINPPPLLNHYTPPPPKKAKQMFLKDLAGSLDDLTNLNK
jgi:hypothetical protein